MNIVQNFNSPTSIQELDKASAVKKPVDSLSAVQEMIRQCMIFDFLSDKDLARFCSANKECSFLIERSYYLEQDKEHRKTSYEYVKEMQRCQGSDIQGIQQEIEEVDKTLSKVNKKIQDSRRTESLDALYTRQYELQMRKKTLIEQEAKLVPHAPEYRKFQKKIISEHVLEIFGGKRKFLSYPILDISAYDMGHDYIDYIHSDKMSSTIMRGEDKQKRVFFAIRGTNNHCTWGVTTQVFFQRYHNSNEHWANANKGLLLLDGHFIAHGKVKDPKNQEMLNHLKTLIRNGSVQFQWQEYQAIKSYDIRLT